MNKNMMLLLVFAAAGAIIFYCHKEGYFSKVEHRMEQKLHNICDPSQRDCSDLEKDLEV